MIDIFVKTDQYVKYIDNTANTSLLIEASSTIG